MSEEVNGVEFEEKKADPGEIPALKIEPPTFGEDLMNLGIVKSVGDAAVLMAIFAFLLISVSIYLLATSVHTPSTLQNGTDSNPKETVQN